jgi:CDP-diacylglycerol pyrophosphatase
MPAWIENEDREARRLKTSMLTKTITSLVTPWTACFLTVFAAVGWAADRSDLWEIVHDRCIVGATKNADPAPCRYLNLSMGERNGYAVLKDINGATQFLLIPTRRFTGIESPEIVAQDGPNYWRAAWDAKKYINLQLGRILPREAFGLAVNASSNRTQDQLHIHIDCIQPDVMTELSLHSKDIHESWADLPFELLPGRRFIARRIDTADLRGVNPFNLLYSRIEAARGDMAHQTLILVGATFAANKDGFILLTETADGTIKGSGHGEDLLDHGCTIRSRLMQ